MLSANTAMFTVVAWSMVIDFAVVVTSKSNVQSPAASKSTPEVVSGLAIVNVAAVSPVLLLDATGTVSPTLTTI